MGHEENVPFSMENSISMEFSGSQYHDAFLQNVPFSMKILFPWNSLALSIMMLSSKMSLFSLENSSPIRYTIPEE